MSGFTRPSQPLQLQSYLKTLKASDFKKLKVRNSTKGSLTAHFHLRDVWVENKKTKLFLHLKLLVRRDNDGQTYYSLCYSPTTCSIGQLATGQAQRVFVERVFEEGKNIVGMGDYQTRSWEGFHRHMSLCSLSLLFLMKQKIDLLKKVGVVTAYQIQELVNLYITSLSSIEIIQNLTKRVVKYQDEITFKRKTVT